MLLAFPTCHVTIKNYSPFFYRHKNDIYCVRKKNVINLKILEGICECFQAFLRSSLSKYEQCMNIQHFFQHFKVNLTQHFFLYHIQFLGHSFCFEQLSYKNKYIFFVVETVLCVIKKSGNFCVDKPHFLLFHWLVCFFFLFTTFNQDIHNVFAFYDEICVYVDITNMVIIYNII